MRVTIVEVGPRDGLQNEAAHVSTADKIGLVATGVAAAGVAAHALATNIRKRKEIREGTDAGAPDKAPILNKEPLVYEEVHMSTRSYK